MHNFERAKIAKQIMKKIISQRLQVFIVIVTIAGGWILGRTRSEKEIFPYLKEQFPKADHFTNIGNGCYKIWLDREESRFSGYASVGEGIGYGGTLRILVAVDTTGIIRAISVVDHKETQSFFRRVVSGGFIESLKEKLFSDDFNIGRDIEAVSGATCTCRGILEAVRRASRKAVKIGMGFSVPEEPDTSIRFGFQEELLIFLIGLSLVGGFIRFKYKKILRWISMITGLIFIGFVFNVPLTLSFINKLLIGYWPDWKSNLYYYILFGTIVFTILIFNRNLYCRWICPFGAAQECIGLIGGVRESRSTAGASFLFVIPGILAWFAILMALIFRNPSISSYEIFGTLFGLIGSDYQFVLLALILILSLVVIRPWCSYLCPIPPVFNFIRIIRSWGIKSWKMLLKRKEALRES